MFEGTEGQCCLLHVGRRTYPDGGKHRTILADAGDSEAEIARTTSLPPPLGRGSVVAILELGSTRLASLDERSTPEVQSGACALGADMGRYLTTVRRSAFLSAPVPMPGKPGLFRATVPLSSLPEGWQEIAEIARPRGTGAEESEPKGRPQEKQLEKPRIRQTYG